MPLGSIPKMQLGFLRREVASSWICGLHRSDFEYVLRYRGAEQQRGSEETAYGPNGTYTLFFFHSKVFVLVFYHSKLQ
jgi:hypothetical protein